MEKVLFGRLIFILGSLLVLGTSCADSGRHWVYIDPIQCLGNSWEQDWLLTHDYDEYPRDDPERLRIFREFYESQGIVIQAVKMTVIAGATCDACSCPTGERIHCLIDETDLAFMISSGFTEGSPPT